MSETNSWAKDPDMKLEPVQCVCTVWLILVTGAGLGAQDLSSAPAALAGLHKINRPSCFRLQPDNGEMNGAHQAGFRSVQNQISKQMIHKCHKKTYHTFKNLEEFIMAFVWKLRATRRQITKSQLLLTWATFSLPPLHCLCWQSFALGPPTLIGGTLSKSLNLSKLLFSLLEWEIKIKLLAP